jgi:hypothetical protein
MYGSDYFYNLKNLSVEEKKKIPLKAINLPNVTIIIEKCTFDEVEDIIQNVRTRCGFIFNGVDNPKMKNLGGKHKTDTRICFLSGDVYDYYKNIYNRQHIPEMRAQLEREPGSCYSYQHPKGNIFPVKEKSFREEKHIVWNSYGVTWGDLYDSDAVVNVLLFSRIIKDNWIEKNISGIKAKLIYVEPPPLEVVQTGPEKTKTLKNCMKNCMRLLLTLGVLLLFVLYVLWRWS